MATDHIVDEDIASFQNISFTRAYLRLLFRRKKFLQFGLGLSMFVVASLVIFIPSVCTYNAYYNFSVSKVEFSDVLVELKNASLISSLNTEAGGRDRYNSYKNLINSLVLNRNKMLKVHSCGDIIQGIDVEVAGGNNKSDEIQGLVEDMAKLLSDYLEYTLVKNMIKNWRDGVEDDVWRYRSQIVKLQQGINESLAFKKKILEVMRSSPSGPVPNLQVQVSGDLYRFLPASMQLSAVGLSIGEQEAKLLILEQDLNGTLYMSKLLSESLAVVNKRQSWDVSNESLSRVWNELAPQAPNSIPGVQDEMHKFTFRVDAIKANYHEKELYNGNIVVTREGFGAKVRRLGFYIFLIMSAPFILVGFLERKRLFAALD